MVWLATKNDIFSIKPFYFSLENRRAKLFLMTQYGILRCPWELASLLGKQLGPKDFDSKSTQKEGLEIDAIWAMQKKI